VHGEFFYAPFLFEDEAEKHIGIPRREHDMSFSGFTKEALRFLYENKMNNSKEWFDSHKDKYKKYVYNPFAELITELAPT